MRIHIPELKSFNGSYSDSYKAMYSHLSYEVLRLDKKFSSRAINDIIGYQIGILIKVMRSFYSFITVVENCKDYVVAASIIRIIADNIATFLLIYHEKSEEEKYLRHYLFLLYGFDKRMEELENHKLEKDNHILDKDFDALKLQVEKAKADTRQGIQHCNQAIKNLPIYSKNRQSIDAIIAECNWKYSDFYKPKSRKSWESMYQLIDTRKSMPEMFSFLSHFVHGLSISNLIIEGDESDFEPLIGFGIFLMSKIHEIANNDYTVSEDFLREGFFSSTYGEDFLSYFSPEMIQELIRILNKGRGE